MLRLDPTRPRCALPGEHPNREARCLIIGPSVSWCDQVEDLAARAWARREGLEHCPLYTIRAIALISCGDDDSFWIRCRDALEYRLNFVLWGIDLIDERAASRVAHLESLIDGRPIAIGLLPTQADLGVARACFRNGACGILPVDADDAVMIDALAAFMRDGWWLLPGLADRGRAV